MRGGSWLLYEALWKYNVRSAMKGSFYGFTDLHKYLKNTRDFLEQSENYNWSAWAHYEEESPSMTDADGQAVEHSGVWIEIVEPDGPAGAVQNPEVFFDDYTSRLVESDTQTATRGMQQREHLRVLDQDLKNRRLLVSRLPETAYVGVRPNTYAVDRQIAAVQRLQNQARMEHLGLHRLVQDQSEVDWPNVDDSDGVGHWYVLTDPGRPGTEQQRRFVIKALNSPDFSILEGPPGSGKTTAICELVNQLVARGKRVLVCASAHVAVDNVLERLDAETNPLRDHILALRIGKDKKISERLGHLTLERRVETERRTILTHLNAVEQPTLAQERLLELLSADGKAIQRLVLDTANVVCGTTLGILQHPDIKDANREHPLFDVLILDEASKTTFHEFLVPAVLAKRWVLSGDIRQLSPFRSEQELAAHLRGFVRKQQHVAVAGIDFLNLMKRNGVHRILLEDTNEAWTDLYVDKATSLGLSIGSVRNGHAPDGQELILTSHLAAIDASTSRSPATIARRAVAVADEVVEWSEELAWRLGTRFELRFTDALRHPIDRAIDQLMPPVRPAASNGARGTPLNLHQQVERLERIALPSVLESLQHGVGRRHAGIRHTALTSGMPDVALRQRHELLTYQHRMHPDISAFPRAEFYNGMALNDSPGLEDQRSWTYPRYADRVTWANVQGPAEARTKANRHEAAWIASEIQHLHDWNQRTPSLSNWTVAVICFYLDQERELRGRLRGMSGQRHSYRQFTLDGPGGSILIDLCTVDGIQGQEADVVYLSLALNRTTWFTRSMNRVNVALTRARYQLVIVGNHHAISRSGPPNPIKLLARQVNPILTWKTANG